MPRLRKEVHVVNKNDDFLLSIRCGDWINAFLLVNSGAVTSTISVPGTSIFAWLIELNAPTELVTLLLKKWITQESIDVNRLDLLELCIYHSLTKSNAQPTFYALLNLGLSPNVIVNGGATLLQRAMELDKKREVELLLQYGADPQQLSVFGPESTTNLQEAESLETKAAQLAADWFRSAKNN